MSAKPKNIVYQFRDDLKSKLPDFDAESISTVDSVDQSDRKFQILSILKEHELSNCKPKLLAPISSKDSDGYIYAYYSNSNPGIFKVGRSKDLPFRRIKSQEKNNDQKYRNKESFHCCFHHLVEACIHIELKLFRVKLNKKQDGYTEWFKIDWEVLKKKITSVINAIMQLYINKLLLVSYNEEDN